HDSDGFHWQEDDEGLRGKVVPAFATVVIDSVAQLVDKDGIGAAQQVCVFLFDFAENANAQARPRERMAVDHCRRQPQSYAQLTDLVFEKLTQRLKQLQIECFRQPTDIVVRLD